MCKALHWCVLCSLGLWQWICYSELHTSIWNRKSQQHRVRMPSQFYQVVLLALAHVDIVQKLFAMPSEAVRKCVLVFYIPSTQYVLLEFVSWNCVFIDTESILVACAVARRTCTAQIQSVTLFGTAVTDLQRISNFSRSSSTKCVYVFASFLSSFAFCCLFFICSRSSSLHIPRMCGST